MLYNIYKYYKPRRTTKKSFSFFEKNSASNQKLTQNNINGIIPCYKNQRGNYCINKIHAESSMKPF